MYIYVHAAACHAVTVHQKGRRLNYMTFMMSLKMLYTAQLYTEAACVCAATRLDCNFLSSIVCVMVYKERKLYLGNGTGNQSQTWSKVSSRPGDTYRDHEKAICRVFLDPVTYNIQLSQVPSCPDDSAAEHKREQLTYQS